MKIDKNVAMVSVYKILFAFPEVKDAPCSANHHLNVKGGLLIHTKHVLATVKHYFKDDADYGMLHFLAGIHDIGKARVYEVQADGKVIYKKPEADHILHTITMLGEAGITLNREELNALQFHHGGWSGFKGELTPLAVKLHFCDLLATIEETAEHSGKVSLDTKMTRERAHGHAHAA